MTRTKTKPETPPVPAAPELVELAEREITCARRNSARVTAATVQADAEIQAAEQAVEEALDSLVRGREGADEQHSAALTRRYNAVGQRVGLDEQQAACMKAIRGEQERVRQLREANLDEFLPPVEVAVEEALDAAEAARPFLEAYTAAFNRAAQLWKPLAAAVRSKVEADETAAGFYRSGEGLDKDLRVPACPVSSSVLTQIATVVPRPPAMAEGFDGNPFRSELPSPENVDIGPDLSGEDGPVMFDSDRQ